MNAVSLISLLTLFIALSARFISSLGRPRGDSHKRGVLIVQASAVQKLAAHAKRSRLGWLTVAGGPLSPGGENKTFQFNWCNRHRKIHRDSGVAGFCYRARRSGDICRPGWRLSGDIL